MKTDFSIELPDRTRVQLAKIAADEGVTLEVMVERALRMGMAQLDEIEVARPRHRPPPKRPSKVDSSRLSWKNRLLWRVMGWIYGRRYRRMLSRRSAESPPPPSGDCR